MNSKVFAKVAFIAIFTTISTAASFAQTHYKLGFSLGSNYSSLRSDLFTTSSGRLSTAVGFNVNLGFGDRFELTPEIMFTQKGATIQTVVFNPENKPTVGTYNFYYNTFEAGVFAGYQPIANVPVRVQAGAFFGSHFHNLDRSDRDEYVGDYNNIVNAKQVSLLNESLSGLDFGPAFGVSAGAGRFNVSARYYMGARNLYENLAFAPQGHHIRTSSLRLTMTYYFKHKSSWED
ncbi:MAG TPA: outer membrane beta-barrel protein [Saprospiraceae bacterium]|nr:outer membrane beta-barrel protein [Saprospiraceae bacterium]